MSHETFTSYVTHSSIVCANFLEMKTKLRFLLLIKFLNFLFMTHDKHLLGCKFSTTWRSKNANNATFWFKTNENRIQSCQTFFLCLFCYCIQLFSNVTNTWAKQYESKVKKKVCQDSLCRAVIPNRGAAAAHKGAVRRCLGAAKYWIMSLLSVIYCSGSLRQSFLPYGCVAKFFKVLKCVLDIKRLKNTALEPRAVIPNKGAVSNCSGCSQILALQSFGKCVLLS